MRDHPRLRRALRLTAKIFGFFVLGLITIVAIVLLTINLPPVSGWVASAPRKARSNARKNAVRATTRHIGHSQRVRATTANSSVVTVIVPVTAEG